MANQDPFVSAIIVNYRSSEHAICCISTLLQQRNVKLEIIVVDNCSNDDSVLKIRAAYPDQVYLIENQRNDGFGKANNLAASQASGDYILIINPDIKLLKPDDLLQMVTMMEENPTIGMLGPNIIESRRNKRVSPKLHYTKQSELKSTLWLKSLPGKYAWLLGACLLFRRDVYQEIKGFDEEFFLYGEDTDIGLRVRKAGFIIGWAENVEVDHWGGASEVGATSYDKWQRKKRGYYQFCLKHYDTADAEYILRKALSRCNIKLFFLKFRLKFSTRPTAVTDLEMTIDRIKAERDVLIEYISR